MKMKTQSNMSELFDQAIETFDSALKTGVRIQEEATRWWTDMMRETDSLQELQHRAQAMMMEALPTAQRNVDQYMRLLDKSYHTGMNLMQSALQATPGESLSDAQGRIQEFWEATFAALRNNAQAMVQVNTRTMDAWARMARQDMTEGWGSAREGAQKAAQAAQAAAQATQRTAHAAQKSAQAAAGASSRSRSRSSSRTR